MDRCGRVVLSLVLFLVLLVSAGSYTPGLADDCEYPQIQTRDDGYYGLDEGEYARIDETGIHFFKVKFSGGGVDAEHPGQYQITIVDSSDGRIIRSVTGEYVNGSSIEEQLPSLMELKLDSVNKRKMVNVVIEAWNDCSPVFDYEFTVRQDLLFSYFPQITR